MRRLLSIAIPCAMAALGFLIGSETRESTTQRAEKPGANEEANAGQAEDLVGNVLGALREENALRQIAGIGNLLETMDPKQWRRLLDHIESFPGREREELLPRLIAIWARLDPKSATEWMKPRLDALPQDYRRSPRLESREWRVIWEWASNAPDEAIEYARKFRHYSEARNAILLSATSRRWDGNFAKGFELTRDFVPADQRDFAMSNLTRTWAETDREAAFAAAASLSPGRRREDAISGVLEVWASTDPVRALELAASNNVDEPTALARILVEAAKGDPSQAAKWLENRGEADGGFKARVLATTWANHDPAAALKWAMANGVPIATPINRTMVGGMFNSTGVSPLAAAMQKDFPAALAFIESMPPGEERMRSIQLAIPRVTDFEKLKSFMGELAPEAVAAVVGKAAWGLVSRDKEKAFAWAATLSGEARKDAWVQIGFRLSRLTNADTTYVPPVGPDRDAMISGMASSGAIFRPEFSLNKAMEINDPEFRQQTLHYIVAEVTRSGDEGRRRVVRQWLESANVPSDWKRNWNP